MQVRLCVSLQLVDTISSHWHCLEAELSEDQQVCSVLSRSSNCPWQQKRLKALPRAGQGWFVCSCLLQEWWGRERRAVRVCLELAFYADMCWVSLPWDWSECRVGALLLEGFITRVRSFI